MNNLPELIMQDGDGYYDIDDVRSFWRSQGAKYVMRWDTWFNGQTGAIINGRYCVFDYDFKRFCTQNGISIG